MRWRIEAFFDYSEAIWSTRDILLIRKLCVDTTGQDPFLVEKPALIELARRFDVRLACVPRKIASLRDALIRHLAVNRHLVTPKTS